MKAFGSNIHVSIVGFAIFLVINASQAWGGVFPFLPMSFQTDEVTLAFYLTQSLAFFATFVISTFKSYQLPRAAKKMAVGIATALVFLGSASIIAAMYVSSITLVFVILGGLMLGIGCAGMFIMWQCYFASTPPHMGNFRLACGTALASLLYFALYLIPNALTAFLVPLVMLPLSSLALTLSVREMSFDQPMFEDIPREHPHIYRRVLRDMWRSSIGIAAIAFTSGLARGVALLDANVNAVINISSMLGSLIAAVVLIAIWSAFTVRFSVDSVFRVTFPILVTGLLFFPFMHNAASLNLFAGIAYMALSLITIVMMMQSAQVSRDRGINPIFSYGVFASVAYGTQSVGFLLGWLLYDGIMPGIGSVEFLSLLALYALGMALFVSSRLFKVSQDVDGAGMVELIRLKSFTTQRKEYEGAYYASLDAVPNELKSEENTGEPNSAGNEQIAETPLTSLEKDTKYEAEDTLGKTQKYRRQEKDDREFTDRLSKQCLVLRQEYGLTNRETEVMEAIARGLSMASIAETLFISENTVRTHAKHIYTKLDIHSRQELGTLLQTVNPNFD